MIKCRLLGHDLRFEAEGARLKWRCARGCGLEGEKAYDSEDRARRYAEAFNRTDSSQLGRRAPLGASPLRLIRVLRRRRERG